MLFDSYLPKGPPFNKLEDMKTYILAISALFSFTLNAADFTGAWSGTGKGTDYGGGEYGCTVSDFTITHSAQKFTISEGDIECGVLFWRWPETDLDISGGQLYWAGVNVGTIAENTVQMDIEIPGNSTSKSVTLKMNNGVLEYLDKKIDKDGVFFTVEVPLTK